MSGNEGSDISGGDNPEKLSMSLSFLEWAGIDPQDIPCISILSQEDVPEPG